MKKYLVSTIIVLLVVLMSACGGKTEALQNERDSIALENKRLNEFLDIVSISMDSISGQERFLYQDRDGRILSNKEQIRNNIRLFKYKLDEQQKRIDDLQRQLTGTSDERSRKLQAVISSLQAQLQEKNRMIERLQEELEKKDVDIASLRTSVSDLTTSVNSLTQEVEDLNEANQAKDAQLEAVNEEMTEMSTGYIAMGTKSELTGKGLLKGGFLKKKKVQISEETNPHFRKVDIRSDSSFDIPGKNAKVVSAQPASSYTIEENGGTSVLKITNGQQFWGASRYVIIQYK